MSSMRYEDIIRLIQGEIDWHKANRGCVACSDEESFIAGLEQAMHLIDGANAILEGEEDYE